MSMVGMAGLYNTHNQSKQYSGQPREVQNICIGRNVGTKLIREDLKFLNMGAKEMS